MRRIRVSRYTLEKYCLYGVITVLAIMLPLFSVKLLLRYGVVSLDSGLKRLWDWPFDLLIYALLMMLFLLTLLFRRETAPSSKSILAAFFFSFIIEMYGFAYSFYLLAAVIGPTRISDGYLRHGALPGSTYLPFEVRLLTITVLWAIGLYFVTRGWKAFWANRRKLCTEGIYRLMRHPQYLGFYLILTGTFFFFPTPFLLITYVILCITYYRLARKEEKRMIKLYGDQYTEYMERVGMFWPKSRRVKPDSITPG